MKLPHTVKQNNPH